MARTEDCLQLAAWADLVDMRPNVVSKIRRLKYIVEKWSPRKRVADMLEWCFGNQVPIRLFETIISEGQNLEDEIDIHDKK